MQNEIIEPSDLLDSNGNLIKKGWARKHLLNYNRENIQAGWHRIKEWDYYAMLNPQYGITFTFSDLGYLGLIAVCWLDFKEKTFHQEDKMILFPKGDLGLPESPNEGNIIFSDKDFDIKFQKEGNYRNLFLEHPTFDEGDGIKAELNLYQDPNMDSLVIATPFEKEGRFYYNHKINCMPTKGRVRIGAKDYFFDEETSFGVLDWGRGVWTYSNTWYWGSASGKLEDGKLIGFNIGYGFGDTSSATENIVYYEGKGHKLDEVKFQFDEKNYLKPWKFTSNDGRFEMSFDTIVDRNSYINLLLLKSSQHQVFGYFSGKIILDDEREIRVRNLLGFAEKVVNRL